MSKTIVLDPGHGGADPGATNGSRYESHEVLKLGLAIETILTAQGHTVVMTRRTDVHVPLTSRGGMANTHNADAFVSLHRNSHTTASANGVEVYYHPSAPTADKAMAAEVLERIAAVGIQTNRGVKAGAYQVLTDVRSGIPAIMIELGFISNAKDNALFDQHFDAYALAIAKGILAAIGEPYVEEDGATDAKDVRIAELEAELAQLQADHTWLEQDHRVMEQRAVEAEEQRDAYRAKLKRIAEEAVV